MLFVDKGNLGNAKILGLVTDFGGDPTGSKYALLNGTYFIGYVAFRAFSACLSIGVLILFLQSFREVFWGSGLSQTWSWPVVPCSGGHVQR